MSRRTSNAYFRFKTSFEDEKSEEIEVEISGVIRPGCPERITADPYYSYPAEPAEEEVLEIRGLTRDLTPEEAAMFEEGGERYEEVVVTAFGNAETDDD